MRPIRSVDLQAQYQRLKPEIHRAVNEVLESCDFVGGPVVGLFARHLAHYVSVNEVVPCANGTDALQIAFRALGLSPGDEVILPANTYVATLEAVVLCGLCPVLVDVEAQTFTIDTACAETAITSRTRAIVPVHLYGQCAQMAPLLALAQKYGLFVVEDTAQALGAEYIFADGTRQKAGTLGTLGTTSFYPSKNLGAYGDGGALLVPDVALARICRMMANHGQEAKNVHQLLGFNSRLDTLQAAVLNVKLNYLDNDIARRHWVAAYYDQALGQLPYVAVPKRAPYSTHVFHQYTITLANRTQRDALQAHLADSEIPTAVYYPTPLHLQAAYTYLGYGKGCFPVAEHLSETTLSLPIHTDLDEEQLHYIATQIHRSQVIFNP